MKTTISQDLIFTILIGSTARRSDNMQSDVDIVRIGHRGAVPLAARLSLAVAEISYVDYDVGKFSQLYENGSLFLYHVFCEGRLLQGNRRTWSALKRKFCVQTNFQREIEENRAVLEWLQAGTQYEGATIPYLAHTCRALKNLAIFSLAQGRNYVFDKRRALRKAFPELEEEAISVLIGANNAFERSRVACSNVQVLDANILLRVRTQVAQAIGPPKSHASP